MTDAPIIDVDDPAFDVLTQALKVTPTLRSIIDDSNLLLIKKMFTKMILMTISLLLMPTRPNQTMI